MVINYTKFGTLYEEVDGRIIKKQCTQCAEIKCITEFNKEKRSFAGVNSSCKLCFRVKSQKIKRKYREKNPEKVKEWNRNSYRNNPEKYKQNSEKWRAENPDKRSDYSKRYYSDNIDKVKYYNREWEKANPKKVLASVHNRRAKELSLPHSLEESDIDSVINKFQGCALSYAEDAQIDHFIPLSIGGPGSVLGNIITISQKLNSSKGTKNPFEWFSENKERLSLPQNKFDAVVLYLANINSMSVAEYREYVYKCFNKEDSE